MKEKVAIVGAGPGGYVAAVRAAQLGADVTVVENEQVGGTCLNWGCVPSKILKSTADRLDISLRFREFAIVTEGKIRLDMDALSLRKEHVIQTQRKAIEKLFRHNRVQYEKGRGRILGYGKLEVNRLTGELKIIPWDRLLIATGSRTTAISSFPFDGKRVISSNEALFLNTIPASIVIVGGGVIGCEFAFIFAGLGSKVTVIEAMGRLLPLPSVDEENSKVLQREMKKRKIDFFVNRTIKRVEYGKSGLYITIGPSPLSDTGKGQGREPFVVEAEKLLVCIGRSPNTVDIGIDSIGITTDKQGWIQANNRMATSVKNVYAIGDVLGPDKVMMAHVASAEGVVAAENAMGGNCRMNYDVIPGAIFTSPEVADVGITEKQAINQGIRIRTDTVLFRNNSKAQILGEIAGQVKMISHRDTGKILGVHIIGPHATDLIAEGALAVQMGCTVKQLAWTIHAHPTLAEVMLETSLKALDRGLHG